MICCGCVASQRHVIESELANRNTDSGEFPRSRFSSGAGVPRGGKFSIEGDPEAAALRSRAIRGS